MNDKQRELKATLAVLDAVIEKARSGQSVFLQEVRALDLECRGMLRRELPAYPHLTDCWAPTPESPNDMGTLEDVRKRLAPMRSTLSKAIELAS